MPAPVETGVLVGRASRGDGTAIDTLLEANLPALRAYVRLKAGRLVRARESVGDLVQSVCREVLQDLSAFEYRDEAGFRAWLLQQAARKVIDRGRFWRAERRDGKREISLDTSDEDDEELQQVVATFLTPSRDASSKERLQRFEAALAELADDHREAILLRHVAGLPYDEIARQLDKSEGATRNLVYRGLAKIAVAMQLDANSA